MKIIWLFRSILFAVGQMSTLIFFSLFGQLLRPFSHAVRYRFMHYWAKFCIWWLKVTCGLSYRVHGEENIDRDKAGLILARHESAWETLAFQVNFSPSDLCFEEGIAAHSVLWLGLGDDASDLD